MNDHELDACEYCGLEFIFEEEECTCDGVSLSTSDWLETEEDVRQWIKWLDETDGWLKTENETSKSEASRELHQCILDG